MLPQNGGCGVSHKMAAAGCWDKLQNVSRLKGNYFQVGNASCVLTHLFHSGRRQLGLAVCFGELNRHEGPHWWDMVPLGAILGITDGALSSASLMVFQGGVSKIRSTGIQWQYLIVPSLFGNYSIYLIWLKSSLCYLAGKAWAVCTCLGIMVVHFLLVLRCEGHFTY